MNLKKSILIALGLAYFGEYASLISLLEYSKKFGGADHPVLLYIIYSLPALFLLIISTFWKNSFTKTLKAFPFILTAGSLVVLAVTRATTFPLLMVGIFAIALFKQWVKILALGTVRQNFVDGERSTILSKIVSLRFVVMILGASVGGILSSYGLFSVTLMIHASVYLIAALFMLGAFYRLPVKHNQEPFQITASWNETLQGFTDLKTAFGFTFLSLIILSCLAVGAFMALEYPILTMNLDIPPSLLFITYMGHILGAVLAQRVSTKIDKSHFSASFFSLLVFALISSFFLVGAGYQNLIWISMQLGICAFLLPLSEIYYSDMLMSSVTKERYSFSVLALNLIVETSLLVGSVITLPMMRVGTALDANRWVQFVVAGVVSLIVLANSNKKILRFFVPVNIGILVLAINLLGFRSVSDDRYATQLDLHSEMHKYYGNILKSTEEILSESSKALEESFLKNQPCDPARQNRSEADSSFYVPLSSRESSDLDCFRSKSKSLEGIWNRALDAMPFISWIYSYDDYSGTLRIAPSTDTQTLFGKDLRFDKFSFNTAALAKNPEIAWGEGAKEDIIGTGLILIASKALTPLHHKSPLVVSVDLNVNRILKSKAKDFLQMRRDLDLQDLIVFLYTKTPSTRFAAGHWVIDENQWSTLKPTKGEILSVSENEYPSLKKLEDSAVVGKVSSAKMNFRGSSHFCTMSRFETPSLFLWICSKY